jgi:alkylation response protein AidB-like acyl-CoA dehydrogenase
MEFRLNDGQVALRDTIARFGAEHFGVTRAAEYGLGPIDRNQWRSLADLGIFNMLIPERDGGVGLGAVEGAIVYEQLGVHLVPGPLLWSTLAAPFIEGAATGARLVGGLESPRRADEPILVEHASDIDTLVMITADGVLACDRSELPLPTPQSPLDPCTPVGLYAELPNGTRVGDAGDAAQLRRLGTVLSAALLLGLSASALAVARDYALEREQFGVPIGSFQAVKHMLADMFVRNSLARSATYAAAAVCDDPAIGDPAHAAGTAKLLAGDAAIANARAAIQILGGMGFTWEMPPHYLLKRAWVFEHSFGTADDHALALSASIEG